MNTKTLLAGVAALAMMTGAAVADGNEAFIDQVGSSNVADITQDGSDDAVGSSADAALQDGDNNTITVDQTGNGLHLLGAGSNSTTGVDQSGDRNELTVTQGGNGQGGRVRNVQQVEASTATALTEPTNTLSITQDSQSGSAVIVGTVEQTYTGGGAAGTQNALTITQAQKGNPGSQVTLAIQDGSSNTGSISQGGTAGGTDGGTRQFVDLFEQTGTLNSGTVEQNGIENRATLVQRGDRNATVIDQDNVRTTSNQNLFNDATVVIEGDDNGVVAPGGVAAVGVLAGTVSQNGRGNMVDLLITGDSNAFGVTQTGLSNTVGMLTITGDGNDLGIAQTGDANEVALGTVEGSSNEIGITQSNNDNFAQIDLVGFSDDNVISITQADAFGTGGRAIVSIEGASFGGDANTVTIFQQASGDAEVGINGDDNDVRVRQFNGDVARITIGGDGEGSNNFLDVLQANGNPNTVVVDIYGDDNNRGAFSGVASLKASAYSSGGLGGNGLQAGELEQRQGSGNLIDIAVGDRGGSIEGDGNLFAVGQIGSDNTVNGTIMGDMNQAVVTQLGNANMTTFMQNGTGNVLGVSQ